MIVTKRKNKDDLKIQEILEEEYESCMMKELEDMSEEAKSNIF